MKRTVGGAVVLAAVLALTPLQTLAQQGRMGGGRGMGMGVGLMARARADSLRGPGPEAVLRLKEQLALTNDQVKRLDQIREDAVKHRTEHMAQMEELRSQLRAGEIKPEELRKQMQAQRDATAPWRSQQLERVRAVLNDTQRQKLEEMQVRARAFMRGRRSAMRGGRPGMWGGGRGGMMGGRGFAPRMRQGMRGGGMGMQQAPNRPGRPFFRGRGPGGPGFGPPDGAIPPDTVPPVGG